MRHAMGGNWDICRPAGRAIGAILLAATVACTPAGEVEPGMSSAEVVRILGEPTRMAMLEGKVLREVAPGEDVGDRRVVYFYEASGLQVWLQNGAVTGVVRDGVAAP